MLQWVIVHTLAAFNCELCLIIFEDSDSNLVLKAKMTLLISPRGQKLNSLIAKTCENNIQTNKNYVFIFIVFIFVVLY